MFMRACIIYTQGLGYSEFGQRVNTTFLTRKNSQIFLVLLTGFDGTLQQPVGATDDCCLHWGRRCGCLKTAKHSDPSSRDARLTMLFVAESDKQTRRLKGRKLFGMAWVFHYCLYIEDTGVDIWRLQNTITHPPEMLDLRCSSWQNLANRHDSWKEGSSSVALTTAAYIQESDMDVISEERQAKKNERKVYNQAIPSYVCCYTDLRDQLVKPSFVPHSLLRL